MLRHLLVACLSLVPLASLAESASSPPKPPKPRPPAASTPGERAFVSCVKVPARKRVKVTLKPDTTLGDLVGWISAMTCKRFVLPSRAASQRVTLLSPTPITAREAYRAFSAAIAALGYTVLPRGRLLRLVPIARAGNLAPPTFLSHQRSMVPAGSTVVTQLLRMEHGDLRAIQTLLGQLVGPGGKVLLFAPTRTLLITDSAVNVKRLTRIAQSLAPKAAPRQLSIVRPRHAEARELKTLLADLYPATGAVSSKRPVSRRPGRKVAPTSGTSRREPDTPLLLVDERTNALIIAATKEQHAELMRLVRRLDVDSGGARPRAWVHHLEYADADKLVAAVSGLVSGGGPKQRGRSSGKSKGAGSLFEGRVQLQAEKTNNAIVIFASARDYLDLRAIIRKLDRPRRQVFVEAYVLELTLDRDRAVGVSYHGASQSGANPTTVIGGLGHSEGNSVQLSPSLLTGMALGVLGPTVSGSAELFGTERDLPAFGVMLQALAKTTELDVLASPHLLTTDNEEAEIFVGETVPVKSGVAGLPIAGAQTSGFVNVAREQVGLKLKLKPSIGKGDVVRLSLEQEASSVKDDVGNLGVATGQRTLKTMVSVPDGHTVVIGGLVRESSEKVVQKVPLLGDLPLLGVFFRHTGTVKRKTNLMLVLTPHVIRSHADLVRIYRRKLRQRQDFIRKHWVGGKTKPPHAMDLKRSVGLLGAINQVALEAERSPSHQELPDSGSHQQKQEDIVVK